MLKNPTLDKLITLGLTGMARALQQQSELQDMQSMSFEDRLALMVDAEYSA